MANVFETDRVSMIQLLNILDRMVFGLFGVPSFKSCKYVLDTYLTRIDDYLSQFSEQFYLHLN